MARANELLVQMEINAKVRFAEELRKAQSFVPMAIAKMPLADEGVVAKEKQEVNFDAASFFQHNDDDEESLTSDDDKFSDEDFSSSEEDEIESGAITPVSRSKSSSDFSMKLTAMSCSLSELVDLNCPTTCRFGRACIENATLSLCRKFRNYMWNTRIAAAPTTTERRKRINAVLSRAFQGRNASTQAAKLRFFLEDPAVTVERGIEQQIPRKRKEICESAYIVLLGLSSTMEKPTMWRKIRADICRGRTQRTQKRSCKKLSYSQAFTN